MGLYSKGLVFGENVAFQNGLGLILITAENAA